MVLSALHARALAQPAEAWTQSLRAAQEISNGRVGQSDWAQQRTPIAHATHRQSAKDQKRGLHP